MKKILICGATGFIGRNLVIQLSKNPFFQIIAVKHLRPSFTVKEAINEVIWVEADLRNTNDVSRVLKGIDIVVQAAATTSGAKDIVNKPYIHVTDNALMNSILLREAMNNSITHFIFFSCTVMYDSSKYPIKENDWDPAKQINERYFGVANTKIYIEKMLDFYSRISNMKTTAIRHSNIYGPYDKYDFERSHVCGATISKVLTATKEVVVWGTGEEERDLLYVDDLVEFVQLAISNQKKKYQLYNCGAGESVSIRKLVELIINQSGKSLTISHDISKPTIKTSLCLNTQLAETELNWKPRIPLKEGITKTISWWNENIDPQKLILKANE
mgnify:CR=1 FL=1